MKKGKIFTKGQITVAVMILALGSAIWLNAKYAPSSSKYLGEASYVSGTEEEPSVETAAKVDKGNEDYFTAAQKEREKTREKAEETVEEMLDNKNLTEEDKKKALEKINEMADNIEKEKNIETLLKAKGFEKTLAVIGDSGISIIVKSEGLTSPQTLQIQDIVTNETSIPLSNIKIIPVAK